MNETIAEWMAECWHEADKIAPVTLTNPMGVDRMVCGKCGEIVDRYQRIPDYKSEYSPRSLLAEVEKKVIEQFGEKYLEAIMDVLGIKYSSYTIKSCLALLTASAETRCKAIVELIRE